ncbi:MAG: hypothetical protein V4683_14330 [Bacteroidota bacterium]
MRKLKNLKIGDYFPKEPILTSIDNLEQDGVIPETVVRVVGARVVYANYKLLQHDFPQLQNEELENQFSSLKSLKGLAKKQAVYNKIDEWLIRNTAFISQSQANQSVVNTPIRIGTEKVIAYRPPGYGRALVFSTEQNDKGLLLTKNPKKAIYENRLIDVKGTGCGPNIIPTNKSHSNGIYRLGFAFVELLFQELLQSVFIHSKSNFTTLPIYGILDLGFDERNNRMHHSAAALLVRRAHRRPKDSGGLYPYGSTGQQVQLQVEKLIRKYGITSVNEVTTIKIKKENGQICINYGDQQIDFFNEAQQAEIEKVSHYSDSMGELIFDGINIQHTREIGMNPPWATLVDFQSYSIKETFNNPILSLVSDKLMRWGGSIWPGYPDFISPDSNLKIPFHLSSGTGNIWGYNMGEGKIKMDSLCYGLAADFRANTMSREMILGTLQTYLDALTKPLYSF